MAKCICKMPEDLLKKLSRLGNKMDSITEEVLKVGGEVVLDKVKSNLEGVLSGESTGELASSLGLSKVLVGKDGNANIKVGFDIRHGGLPSIFLMYGTPRTKKDTKLYNDIYGNKTKHKIAEIQKEIFNDEIRRVMR